MSASIITTVTPQKWANLREILESQEEFWVQYEENLFYEWSEARMDADTALESVSWADWEAAGKPGAPIDDLNLPSDYVDPVDLDYDADQRAFNDAWLVKWEAIGRKAELFKYYHADWVAEGKPGPDAIRVNFPAPVVPTITLIPSNAPLDLARHVLATLYPNNTIHFWQGQWYLYDAGIYRVLDETTLNASISPVLEQTQFQRTKANGEVVTLPIVPTIALKREVIDAMKALPGVLLPLWVEANTWIKGGDYPAEELIVMKRCILHWPTRKRIPHTPDLFVLSKRDFDYDPEAPYPEAYINWLMQLWPGDEGIERTWLLEEYMGYCLQTTVNYQKALWQIGATGSGKGVYQRLVSALMGKGSVCGPTLSTLSTGFGAHCLIGKKLAIVGDARLSGKADSGQLTERLLSTIGGDLIEIDRKHVGAWSGTLDIKFLFAANKIPKMEDVSGALARRFLYLDFERTFNPEDDRTLEARIHAELPGILNRALNALDRLIERGHFVQPPSVARDTAEAINNPIAIFADEYLTVAPKATANVQSVHSAYLEWCRDNGRDHTPTVQVLSAMLRERVPTLTTKQFRDGSGARPRFFVGIGLTSRHAASRDWHATVTDENIA